LHALVKGLVGSNGKDLPYFVATAGLVNRTSLTIRNLSKVVTSGIACFHSYGMEVEYFALLTEIVIFSGIISKPVSERMITAR
jgi:hypothetical protein